MHFNEMMAGHGFSVRAVQSDYAEAVQEALGMKGRISLLQADTGVGKSLAYSVASLMQMAQPHEQKPRVIISSNTIALLRQLAHKDVPAALDMVAKATGYKPRCELLIGRQNFISRSRLEGALSELSLKQIRSNAEAIKALKDWTEAIDLYISEWGSLPCGLTQDRICQTHYSAEGPYAEIKKKALAGDVIICSHSMLVNDMLLHGNVFFSEADAGRPTYLIVDEADLLHSLLVDRQQIRLNLTDLLHEASLFAWEPLIDILDEASSVVACMAEDRVFHSNAHIQAALRAQLQNISRALRGYSEDEAQSLRARIDALINHHLCRMGAGVSPLRKEPAIVFINPYMSRIFEQYAVRNYQSIVLTSGTLSTLDDPQKGSRWLRRDLGITSTHTGLIKQFSPTAFGHVNFTLAGPDFPAPFQRGGGDIVLNPYWIDEVTKHLRTLEGPVLVLTGSHTESQMIRDSLGMGVVHARGEEMAAVIRRYQEGSDPILITATGKAGMDLRNDDGSQLLKHVVLTRIPYQPRDEHGENELASYIEATHPDVQSPLSLVRQSRYTMNLSTAVRLTKQSIGRGIRDADDCVDVHIMDPRFPCFDAIGSLHAPLRAAIPRRFWPQYQKASILKGSPVLEEIEIW